MKKSGRLVVRRDTLKVLATLQLLQAHGGVDGTRDAAGSCPCVAAIAASAAPDVCAPA